MFFVWLFAVLIISIVVAVRSARHPLPRQLTPEERLYCELQRLEDERRWYDQQR